MNEPVTITRNKLLFYQGGNHGSCVDIRRGLDILMKDKTIAPTAGAKKRNGIQTSCLLSHTSR